MQELTAQRGNNCLPAYTDIVICRRWTLLYRDISNQPLLFSSHSRRYQIFVRPGTSFDCQDDSFEGICYFCSCQAELYTVPNRTNTIIPRYREPEIGQVALLEAAKHTNILHRVRLGTHWHELKMIHRRPGGVESFVLLKRALIGLWCGLNQLG